MGASADFFAIDAQRLDGSWRGKGDEASFTTATGEATAAAVDDPACGPEGAQLTAMAGEVSKSLPRSIVSSECVWRLAPAGLGDGVPRALHVRFVPHPEHAADAAFSVGATPFSPVPTDALELALGVSDATASAAAAAALATQGGGGAERRRRRAARATLASFTNLGVANGVSRVRRGGRSNA